MKKLKCIEDPSFPYLHIDEIEEGLNVILTRIEKIEKMLEEGYDLASISDHLCIARIEVTLKLGKLRKAKNELS